MGCLPCGYDHLKNDSGNTFLSDLCVLWAFDAFSQPDPYDRNGNGLIEVGSVEALYAIRYDLAGDGVMDDGSVRSVDDGKMTKADAYVLAFAPDVLPSGTYMGYALSKGLDFIGSRWVPPDSFGISAGSWEPIGGSGAPFKAIFDGNQHKIANLYIREDYHEANPNPGYAGGLFASIGVRAIVRFVHMENAKLPTVFLLLIEVLVL